MKVTTEQKIHLENARTMIGCKGRFNGKGTEHTKLLNVYNHCKKYGSMHVTYEIKDNGHLTMKTKGSRKALCIDHLWKPVREGLLQDLGLYDYDFANAHVNILWQLARKEGFPCTYIGKYCQDVTRFKALPSKDNIKKTVLAWCNGGKQKLDTKSMEPRDQAFFGYLKAEIDQVQDTLITKDPLYQKQMEEDKSQIPKHKRTYRSAVMARPTSQALFALHNWCTQNDITVATMQCDGSLLDRQLSAEEIEDAERFILSETGYQVHIVKKPITPFNPADWEPDQLYGETDEECAQIFIDQHLGVDVFKAGGGFISYSQRAQKWLDDGVKFKIISDDIGMLDGDSVSPFSKNVAGMTRIHKSFLELTRDAPNTEIVKEINDATKYKIYFQDGYFDLRTGRTGKITNARDSPFWKINRDMPDWKSYSLDHPDVRELRDKVTNCILGDELEPVVMGITARAAAGCVDDKTVHLFPGERDSGKGVFCLIKKVALGTFPAGCCTEVSIPMHKDIDNGDAKGRSWFLSSHMHLARIAICNELSGRKGRRVDGNALKSLASGGDIITARTNHQDERYEYNNSTVFFYFNPPPDGNGVLPPVEPVDALEKCCILEMPFKFVEQSQVQDSAMFKRTDPNIKTWIGENRERLGNAFIWLLHYYWMPQPISDTSYVNQFGTHPLPEYMLENVEVKKTQLETKLSIFNRHFVITDNPEDHVPAQELRSAVGLDTLKAGSWLKKNFRTRLQGCGFKSTTIRVESGLIKAYRGIKNFESE